MKRRYPAMMVALGLGLVLSAGARAGGISVGGHVASPGPIVGAGGHGATHGPLVGSGGEGSGRHGWDWDHDLDHRWLRKHQHMKGKGHNGHKAFPLWDRPVDK